jgi:hypothetical protein
MIVDRRDMIVILSIDAQIGLDKSLVWRVLWEGIAKKGKA